MTDYPIKKFRMSKARSVLQSALKWFQKHKESLSTGKREALVEDLKTLDSALLNKNRPVIDERASKLDDFLAKHSKKSWWNYLFEIVVALAFALVVATIVRQMWFEFQEIPTGSMRPTYKEQDKLVVSKTAFGINLPFSTDHLYFDPQLIKRTNVFTFSADNLPMRDSDSTYFGLFPYKKRLVKRCVGLPGDTLYFYGGKLYGVDKEGKPIREFLDSPWMQRLEYIPFLNFTGEIVPSSQNTWILKQMNLPLGRLNINSMGQIQGFVFSNNQWVKDDPSAASSPHDTIKTYSDFWGIRNYAMAQLLTKEQVLAFDPDVDLRNFKEADLYLQLRHTPSLTYPSPYLTQTSYGTGLVVPGLRSYIPLKSRHLNALMDTLYTARFVVKGGLIYRYSAEEDNSPPLRTKIENLPDGTYEFYHGKAYSISWGGVTSELTAEHPIYNRSKEVIQALFNYGVDFNLTQPPSGRSQYSFPHRYAYFRDGELYAMGGVVLKKDDKVLQKFIAQEKKRQEESNSKAPYTPFIDYGPPTNAEFLKTFGLHVPEQMYLALGDNHAMSGDSRVWGFVPEKNIQGAPSFLMWPAGSRAGFVKNDPIRPWLSFPNLVIWSLATLILLGLSLWHYRNIHRSQLPPDLH